MRHTGRESRADPERALDLKFETLLDALYFESKLAGPERGVTFVDDDGEETRVPYLAVHEKSLARAAVLRARGVERGERTLIVVPTSRDFLYVFFGLLYAGATPCPLAPPASFADLAALPERLRAIADLLAVRRVVTVRPLESTIAAALPGARVLLLEDLRSDAAAADLAAFAPAHPRAGDPALLQCTSGSTGPPKAVAISHENLISNVYQIGWSVGVRPDDVTVSWLPLYHDMGLIGCLLFALYWNLDAVFMSPLRFLSRPATWLEAMARHRGTLSTAPNFAYALTAARATDGETRGLDLSRWRMAGCGAEPIQAATLRRFVERFAALGLSPNVCLPCYGLAEATLAVTFHPIGTPLVVDRLDREALAARGEARDAPPGATDAVEVVSCGRPLPEARVAILDDAGAPLPEDRVGRVLVAGPSVTTGGWLETGDLGYLRGGALRVTGRAKDLVIIRGRKYPPSDFEWAAEEVAGVRRGNAVAFGHADAAEGTEALIVVCESAEAGEPGAPALAAAIAARVVERTGVRPARVVLLPRDTLTKTTSGKLQRSKTRERWLAGELETSQNPGLT